MADSDVIKAFLVKIGYVHDEVALKKITNGIDTATKAIVRFGMEIGATATAVAWGVVRISNNLEKLYFASIRTGDSASSLLAFDLAARRMGASAGAGLSAVETLSAFFRNNPAGTAKTLLENWFPGISVNEKDPVKTLVDIGNAMQKMDFYQARMRGSAAGLTDEQILFLRKPGLGAMNDQMLNSLGPNFERAVEGSHRFNNSLALLEIRLEGFGSQVIDVLQNKFGWSLDKLSTWLDNNGERLTVSIVKGLTKLFDYLEKLEPKLEWLLDKLVELDKATDGWSTIIIGLVAVFPGLISGVTALAGAFALFATGTAFKGISLLFGVLNPLTKLAAAGGLGYYLGTLYNDATGVSTTYSEWAQNIGEWFSNQNAKSLFAGKGFTNEKKDWAIEQLQKMGWSLPQAIGLIANANAESSMDPNAENKGHRGLFQWDSSRWANFEGVAKRSGWDTSDPLAQLKFANYELRFGKEQAAGALLLAAKNEARSGYVASHYYERPGSDVADNIRSGMAVSLAHTTTVHIDGAQEPQAIAEQVAKHQERTAKLSAAIVREFASTAQ